MDAEGDPRAGTRREHIAALDGLRGFGALVVVARHTLNAIAMPESSRRAVLEGPLAFVLNGNAMVQMFFVLSGYVLADSAARSGRPVDVLQFYVRRVFRIHPPYVFGLLVAWTGGFLYAAEPKGDAVTEWLRVFGSIHLSVPDLLASLAFPGHARLQLPVGWTLTVEMVFSFLLPLLVVAARPARGFPLLVVAATAMSVAPESQTLAYGLDFAFGVVMYQERDALARTFGRLPGVLRAAVLPTALLVLAAPLLFGWSVPAVGLLLMPPDRRALALMSVGASLLVAAALFLPFPRRLFSSRPLVGVGEFSYSLYLLHMPVLYLCAPRLAGPVGWGSGLGLLAAVTALSCTFAWAAWRWVERPSIVAGNRVCSWLSRRVGTRALPSALASR
jgi:peptidoglycan/LPS O-acetylase OafA/YrhL